MEKIERELGNVFRDMRKQREAEEKQRKIEEEMERRAAAEQSLIEMLPDEWERYRFPEELHSWDAYAFRPPLPSLSKKILPPHVKMGQPGAHNRAGLALMLATL